VLLLGALAPGKRQPSLPQVVSTFITEAQAASVRLNAEVNQLGNPTTYHFEYGLESCAVIRLRKNCDFVRRLRYQHCGGLSQSRRVGAGGGYTTSGWLPTASAAKRRTALGDAGVLAVSYARASEMEDIALENLTAGHRIRHSLRSEGRSDPR
jgi:hypothetical protein